MLYGVQTWNDKGQLNNKGLMPFNTSLQVNLAENESGQWAIALEPGSKAGFIYIPTNSSDAMPAKFTRSITVSAGRVTAKITSQDPMNNVSNGSGVLYIFLVDV